MPTIEFSINIFAFALVILVSVLAGFILRRNQVVKIRTKVEELEREILNNYAHILELEKENNVMEAKLQDIQIPVIPIKTAIKVEQEQNILPDISLRKKLLSKENPDVQSASGK